MLLGPDGKEVKATITDKGKGVYYVEYTATMVGTYKIEVKFAGAQIPGSVFNVKITHGEFLCSILYKWKQKA